MTDHTYWEELAAGYALDGLSREEEQLFAEHLATCAECTASMKDHDFVAAQLGSIAHYREPEAEVPSWESMRPAIVGATRSAAGSAAAAAEPDMVTDLASRRRRRHDVSRRSLAAAAAVVVVAGGGIATWQLTSGGGTSCSSTAGCHQVELAAAGGKVAAALTIRGTTVTMDPSGMTAAPAGKVYVLWQQPRDGRATAIREFRAASAAPVAATLHAPYADTQQFAVSVENAGPPPAAPSNQVASGLAT